MNIQFDSEQHTIAGQLYAREPKGLVKVVMAWGLASSQAKAERILLVAGIASIIIAIGVFLFRGNSEEKILAPLPSITTPDVLPR